MVDVSLLGDDLFLEWRTYGDVEGRNYRCARIPIEQCEGLAAAISATLTQREINRRAADEARKSGLIQERDRLHQRIAEIEHELVGDGAGPPSAA